MPEVKERTLFLGWQDGGKTREWFPVGRLDADFAEQRYRFCHVKGAERARETGGFDLVPGFPELHGTYESRELFPVFQNRVMSPRRPDFEDYVKGLALDPILDPATDPTSVLLVDVGRRVTDFFEVFPKLTKGEDGSFVCRFFLRGFRHTNEVARERMDALESGERLHVALELTSPTNQPAVQIQTLDYTMIGWSPRYFVHDLMMAMAESGGDYEARVVRVNPFPRPSSHRVLVEMRSRWENHEPMSGEDFEPLA